MFVFFSFVGVRIAEKSVPGCKQVIKSIKQSFTLVGDPLDPFWEPLGILWGCLGGLWGGFGKFLGVLWGAFGGHLGLLGAAFWGLWKRFWLLRRALGVLWGSLGVPGAF